MKVGDLVSTPFGEAKLTLYREIDRIYVLRLPYGMLFANQDLIRDALKRDQENAAAKKQTAAMKLNAAYEAMEKMRRLNLEVACGDQGIDQFEGFHEECTACLLSGEISAAKKSDTLAGKMKGFFKPKASHISANMPRLKKFVQDREEKAKPDRCLTCGSPSCPKHSSDVFRREGITICKECEAVLSLDYVVDVMTQEPKQRIAMVDKMIDLYDRCLLLLNFSSQYIDEVAEGLENTKKLNNKINVGGSSAGIVSGVLGVAAAATILTPAGAPLLIASLMLGSGATAVQTGTDIKTRYFCEPNKIADRILATHGMLLSVLNATGTLRDAANRDHIRSNAFDESSPILQELRREYIHNRPALLVGVTAGRFSLASAEFLGLSESLALTRSARMFSRSGAAAMRTLRFARVAGGALAAATLLIEAQTMHGMVQSLRAGSPCEKAEALRNIKAALGELPLTTNLDKECSAYVAYMNQRSHRMREDEAVRLLLEASKAAAAVGDGRGDLILEGEEQEESQNHTKLPSLSETMSTSRLSSSLRDRIRRHKERESRGSKKSTEVGRHNSTAALSGSTAGSTLLDRIDLYKKNESVSS